MTARLIPHELDLLAHRIDRDGIAAHEPAVQHLVRRARALAVAPVLTGVLADPDAPPVVRERAFARVASRLMSARDPVGPATHALAG